MKSRNRAMVAATVAGLAIALAFGMLYRPAPPPPLATSAPTDSSPAIPQAVERAMAGTSSPVDPAASSAMEPAADVSPIGAAGISEALEQLMGRKGVLSFLQLDDFPRRVVATVDNLGRESAPSLMWPVYPTEGRFTVLQHDGATVISPDNGQRYTPLVLLVEALNVRHVADLYARMYPLLQNAYEELGFPNRSFDDRLLEVIDLLLATPHPTGPVHLDLLEIKGPVPSQRPWVHFQYADPALESLAVGQKMLIRTGPVNERRLKAKLREFRQYVGEHRRHR